jgi:hypothetical protein
MANAAIVINNLADVGTVGASSAASTMPASNLLTPHVSERWRSQSGTAWFVLDLGSLKSIDTVMLRGMTQGASSAARVRLSSTDSTGAAGDVSDSGSLTSGVSTYFDLDYGALLYLLSAPANCRYVRIDLTDPDADYVEAGALLAGLRDEFAFNFAIGGGITTIDRSRKAQSSGGQTLTWNDNQYRQIALSFDWINATQRYGVLERMLRLNGAHKNLLLIVDTDSANLARDCIFGLVFSQTPVAYLAVPDLFSQQLTINERL